MVRKKLFFYSLLGEFEPDVNITVLPSQSVPELSDIDINCSGDIARFLPSSMTPLPPIIIMIHVGQYKVKECDNGGLTINECAYTLRRFSSSLPRTISCTTLNALGFCRFKTVNIVLLSEVG